MTAFFDDISPWRAAYAIKDVAGRHRGVGFIENLTKEGSHAILSLRKFKFRNTNLVVEKYNKPYRNRQLKLHGETSSLGDPEEA